MGRSTTGWANHDTLVGLARAARGGNPDAIEALLGAVRPTLFLFFASRLPSASADDLAQAALIRIARAVVRIDPDRADRYVMTVARNLLRSEYRRSEVEACRHVGLRFAHDVESPVLAADVALEHRELVLAIHRAATTELPPPLRDVVLCLLRGLTAAEIAEQYGIDPVTVRTRILRARTLLRHALARQVDRTVRDGERERPAAQERIVPRVGTDWRAAPNGEGGSAGRWRRSTHA